MENGDSLPASQRRSRQDFGLQGLCFEHASHVQIMLTFLISGTHTAPHGSRRPRSHDFHVMGGSLPVPGARSAEHGETAPPGHRVEPGEAENFGGV